jgi:uncharacterized repeat protein (TIGR01451 family)
VVALAGGGLWLLAGPGADAAPGDIDLELEVTGTYDSSTPEGSLILTVTNNGNGTAVTTTAADVVVNTGVVTVGLDTAGTPVATIGTYNSGTGDWDIPSLAPDESATLTIPFVFTDISGLATATAEVTEFAVGQTDLDSDPAENGTIADQDDEGVFRIQDAPTTPVDGNVWNDIDIDGFPNGNEPAVADTIVTITQGPDVLFAGRTDALGNYSYGFAPDGLTDVQFTQPAGYVFTTQSGVWGGSDPDATGLVNDLNLDSLNRTGIDAGLTAEADLSVQKTPDAAQGSVPHTATYTVQVTNAGPGATDAVEVEDVMGAGADFDDTSEVLSQGSLTFDGTSTATWDVGLLLPGETATATYEADLDTLGTYENTAQVVGSIAVDPDSDPGAAGTACSVQPTDDDCDTASVEVVPEATATDDAITTEQGVASAAVNVLDNDGIFGRAPGEPVPSGWTFTRLGGAEQGRVSCQTNGDCTYTPVEGYAGLDSFQYELTSPTAAVQTITVDLESTYANDGPTARDDQATTGVDTDVVVDVLDNDEDPNDPLVPGNPNKPGDSLEVTTDGVVTPGTAGTFDCELSGACTFNPDPDHTGEASMTYTVTDDGGETDTAELTAVVDPDPLPQQGFTGATGEVTQATSADWQETTVVTTEPGCLSGVPQVDVSWDAVDGADNYLVERRLDPSGDWYTLATTTGTSFIDDLVGEGQVYDYRVTPTVGRWSGVASGPVVAAVPPVGTGPEGC